MAQRKILVDTCVYLRLAMHVHPFLNTPFGKEGHTLHLIQEFDDEYSRQARLHELHPWVSEQQYLSNRAPSFQLSRALKKQKTEVAKVVDTSAYEQGVDLSRVDISALATAFVMELPLATDDTGLREIAMIHEVETIGSIQLLRLLVDEARIDIPRVKEILVFLEHLPDTPASFRYECRRWFPEIERS